MAGTVKSYFEHHSKDYANRHDRFYDFLADYVRNNLQLSDKLKLLDIGCGDGGFVRSLIASNIRLDFFLTDLSYEMVQLTKRNLTNSSVTLFVGDGLNLPLNKEMRFDIIHIDSVLHHLIDKTQGRSTSLIKRMVELLASRLSKNGLLIVDEWYLLSYVIPSFASFLIFYGLKFINFLKLDLSFIGEIQPGLEVNFLNPEKLLAILSEHGRASVLKRTSEGFPSSYKYFLIKEKGRITCVLKKVY